MGKWEGLGGWVGGAGWVGGVGCQLDHACKVHAECTVSPVSHRPPAAPDDSCPQQHAQRDPSEEETSAGPRTRWAGEGCHMPALGST